MFIVYGIFIALLFVAFVAGTVVSADTIESARLKEKLATAEADIKDLEERLEAALKPAPKTKVNKKVK